MKNLYTNVPVIPTVKIIIDYAYSHPDISPPKIPKEIMEELLLTCTTKTPFRHPNGGIYLQVDGVSIGSPLGPLMRNFYMAHIENTVLDELTLTQNLLFTVGMSMTYL